MVLAANARADVTPTSDPSNVGTADKESRECEWLLEHSAEYRSGSRRRLGGILVATIGGGLGSALVIGGLVTSRETKQCDGPDGLACGLGAGYQGGAGVGLSILGGVIGGLSLVVGLPLAIQGHLDMKRVHEQVRWVHLPRVSVSTFPGNVALSASWTF